VEHKFDMAILTATTTMSVGVCNSKLVYAVVVKQKRALHGWEIIAGDRFILDEIHSAILVDESAIAW
jgi:hypothetical protein